MSRNDSLQGTAYDDYIKGFDANDTLNGLAGDDRIDGGAGNDLLDGGTGSDLYEWSSQGNDTINDTGASLLEVDELRLRNVLSSNVTLTRANGSTFGFNVSSPEQVDAFHAAGVANGGTTCEDPPGWRDGAVGKLYLAYLRDQDGNKLCALHRPAK